MSWFNIYDMLSVYFAVLSTGDDHGILNLLTLCVVGIMALLLT